MSGVDLGLRRYFSLVLTVNLPCSSDVGSSEIIKTLGADYLLIGAYLFAQKILVHYCGYYLSPAPLDDHRTVSVNPGGHGGHGFLVRSDIV